MNESERINDSAVIDSAVKLDEGSALRLDDAPKRFQCWSKTWFVAIVIASWVILGGLVVLTIYSIVKWDDSSTGIKDAKEEYSKTQQEITSLNEYIDGLKSKIGTVDATLTEESKKLEDAKAENEKLMTEYEGYKKTLVELEAAYKTAMEEYSKIKAENELLDDANDEKEVEIKKLKESFEAMKRLMATHEKEIKVLQIPTYIVGGVLGLSTAYAIYANVQLSTVNKELTKFEQYRIGFDGLAKGFEDYELLNRELKKSVKREMCANGATLADIKKCDGKSPTITTITTEDNYRFGGIFHEPWKSDHGTYPDEKAFTFSDIQAQRTRIIDSPNALLIGQNNLMQFGKGDIVINSDGKGGTTQANTYEIPQPYKPATFYHEGPFKIAKFNIEALSIITS